MANADGTLAQELSYDAWGRLRNPATQEVYGASEQPVLKLGRGYTGHEHLSLFGLVNMNARLYDPALGRFLSPDPYVQMPDNLQNLNRYSYCLNNPLAYTDESGEFLWFVAAAIIGAVVNVATHWDTIKENGWGAGIGYAIVGGAAGAFGYVAGAAVATSIGISGIAGGALVGAAGGAASGFAQGAGNTAVEGGGLGDMLGNGVSGAIGGTVSGLVVGGAIGGVNSLIKGENIWTGKPTQSVPDVRPRPANVEPDPLPEQLAPEASTKNVTPYQKGEIGVQKAMNDFVKEGGVIHAREVTVELDGVRNRFDFVGELDDVLHMAEIKNGPSAGFTPNQKINLPKLMIDKSKFIPRGGNALNVPQFKNLVPLEKPYQGKYIILFKHYF